ncbi:MAG TPA: glycosyltransferase family 2 protein [Gaiellaceae bacterium]|nr:glycosyltransferase family 2 protein [Gaiellaceae bacterium]
MPVRDAQPFLHEALRSIAEQTHENLEVVVDDDGSLDASAEIAREWAARDRRFRLVRQEPRGFVAASQRGWAEARGRYIAAMGADDVARPRRLEVQLAALEGEGLDACGGGVAYFPDPTDGLRRYERWLNSLTTVEAARRDVFVECPIGHPTLFARADAVRYRAVDWPEDYDLVLRLWAADGRFRNVDEPVLDWRDHAARLARTDERYSLTAFARCKVHYLCLHVLRERPVVVWGAGPVGKLHARVLSEAGVEVAAFVEVDARKIGKRIYGIPVVSHHDGPRDGVALGAVAGEAARARLRELAREQGRREGDDFVAVA